MSTKEYPLDLIQALHLLTGEEPVELEDQQGVRYSRDGEKVRFVYNNGSTNSMYFQPFIMSRESMNFRIYEPPKPEKLEPVELCQEVLDQYCEAFGARVDNDSFCVKFYGALIAQAVKMAREEREAEKKGDK